MQSSDDQNADNQRHRCVQKKKVDFRISDLSKNDTGIPVDFSFQDLKRLEESAPEYASTRRLGKPERKPNQKYFARSLWLNNNHLQDTQNIDTMVRSLFEYPERLGFLDLSANSISRIHNDLLKFINLTILYLHGNQIDAIAEVYKLKRLGNLQSLTLFGNPIYLDASLGNIRTVIKRLLPRLEKLDYNKFTKLEAEMPVAGKVALFVESNGKKTLKPKREMEKVTAKDAAEVG